MTYYKQSDSITSVLERIVQFIEEEVDMKKSIGILLVAVMLGLCGCGGKETTAKKESDAPKLSCKEILTQALKDAEGIKTDSTLFYEEERYEELFEYLYDTSPDRAKDGAYAYAAASYADEISIILADEEKDVSVIKNHLEDRVERRAQDFQGYEPEEEDKVWNSVIDTNGNYVIMVIADNPQDIVDNINEIIDEGDK